MEAQSQAMEAGIPGIWRTVQLALFLLVENPWSQNRRTRKKKKKSPDFTGGRHRNSTFSSGKSVILLQQSSVTSNLTIPFPTRHCTGICLGNRQALGFSKWISPLLSPFPPPGAFGANMDTILHTPHSTVHLECFLLPAQDPYLNQVCPSNLTLSLTPPGLAQFLSFYYSYRSWLVIQTLIFPWFFFFILNFKTVYIFIAEGYLLPVVFNLL